MELEEFTKEWDKISRNKRSVLSLFLTGICFQCKKKVSPPSLGIRGEYVYHFQSTHGILGNNLLKIINTIWS